MKTGNLTTFKSKLNKKQLKKMGKNLTNEDKKELVISNIYGFMDSDSRVTKKEIREELEKFYG